MAVAWQHLYGSAHWQRRRALQLREYPLCKFCLEGRGIPVIATVADHIEPHGGDSYKFFTGALQSLCWNCHDSRKKFLELNGFDPLIGLDGYPVDRNHYWYKGIKQ